MHWDFIGISYLAQDITLILQPMSLTSNKLLKSVLAVSGKLPVFIHSFIGLFFGFTSIIKTVGCGKSHKYTKYTNLQCKIPKTFYKNCIINHLYKQKYPVKKEPGMF
jgi:hypothetical protein